MFDIGFSELVLVGVVALVVIGPERLPKVARTAGLWVGRMRGFVMSVKADIDQELRTDELKRIMEEQARSTGVHEIIEETRESLDDLNKQQLQIDEKGTESAAEGKPEIAQAADSDETPSPSSHNTIKPKDDDKA